MGGAAMRAFLALPISEESKQTIKPVLDEGKKRFPSVKWVQPENLHITLLFFGNINAEEQRIISETCAAAVKNYRAVKAAFKGLGQFPPKGRPRVIFSPLIEGKKQCSGLYSSLFPLFQEQFSLKGRPYSPHITLGRVRKGKKQPPLREGDFSGNLQGEFTIDRIILYQSVLQSGGPVYNEITSFTLQS